MPQTLNVTGLLELRLDGAFAVSFADDGAMTIRPASHKPKAEAAQTRPSAKPNGTRRAYRKSGKFAKREDANTADATFPGGDGTSA